MRKFRKALSKVLDDIVCDICGKSCIDPVCGQSDPQMAEYAVLEASWGYCSRKDEEQYRCEMCEDCFDKLKIHLESLKP